MADINKYIDFSGTPSNIIASLTQYQKNVPLWSELRKNYNYKEHAILRDMTNLRDRKRKDGSVEKSCRLSFGMEKLLVRRMSEFMFAIPVKRIYQNTENDKRKQEVANAIEKVFKYSRIATHNLKRSKDFFACCEIMTLWYTVKSPNSLYGFDSEYKLKCKTFSPMNGVEIYPFFDEYGDMLALSFMYDVTVKNSTATYFETFTDSAHFKWEKGSGGWSQTTEPQEVVTGKIPCIYLSRPDSIYDEVSAIRNEIEYTVSKNSNVISYNSSPILKVVGQIFGEEKRNEDYRLFRMEEGGDVDYVTWNQSVQAVTSHIADMKELFWNLTQLPDISFSNMQKLGNIGYDARETLLTDAHLKVGDESGPWIEFFERETSVVKSFLKQMKPDWATLIDDIEVEHVITPFIQRNEISEIQKRMTANGGKPIESQRESIQRYGRSSDPDDTLKQIRSEEIESTQNGVSDLFESMK